MINSQDQNAKQNAEARAAARQAERERRKQLVNQLAADYQRAADDQTLLKLIEALQPWTQYFINRYHAAIERNNAITADDCSQAAAVAILQAARSWGKGDQPAGDDHDRDFTAYVATAIQRAVLGTINRGSKAELMLGGISLD